MRPFRRTRPVAPPRALVRVEGLEDRITPVLTGRLDPLFDGDGRNSFGTFVGTDDTAAGVAFQSDGRFVVAGTVVNTDGTEDFQILRFNPNGGVDTTFNGTGRVFVAFDLGGGNKDRAQAVAVQPDGKIVVVGSATTAGSGKDVAVVRLNPNGSLDTTFDGDGKATVGVNFGGSLDDVANAIVIQPDGKLLLGGSAAVAPSGDSDFLVIRLTSAGALDTTLGSTIGQPGIFQYTVTSGVELVTGVGLQPDGKIIAVGSTTRAGNRDFSVTRITADGQFDNSGAFQGLASGSGFKNTVLVDFGGKDDNATAVRVLADGKILVAGAGATATTNGTDFALLRLNADGSPDTTFDADGKLLVAFDFGGTKDDAANAVFVQPDGRIVAAGFNTFGVTDKDFAVTRRNADGTADATFDGDGRATYVFDSGGGNVDVALGAALDPSGRFVLVGTASTGTNANELAFLRVHGQEVPLVVSTTADEADGDISTGKLSLREAITLANTDPDDNTITFAAGLTGTITLLADLPAITENTTITGPGASLLTVSGNDVNRVFVVNDQFATLLNVSISGLTLTRGRATSATGGATATLGGVIYSEENLTLTDCVVSNSTVNGAVYNTTGTFTVTRCTFTGNQNQNSAGAILSDNATLVVTDSTFDSNTAPSAAAIFTNLTATVTGSTFSNNVGTSAGTGGGAIRHRAGTLDIIGSTFTNNTAAGQGGAIDSQEGTLTVTNSTFTGNAANGGDGGGVLIQDASTLTLTGSTFSGNTASDTGGGVRILDAASGTVTNSTFSANTSAGFGGGIDAGGKITLTNSTLTGNRAKTNGGGGLAAFGNATVTNTIIAGNFIGMTGTSPNDVAFTIEAGTNNLIGNAATAGGLTNGTNGNIVGVDVATVLVPTLANNGGPTQTHALVGGNNPAIGGGTKTGAPAADQRGFVRPADPAFFPDIGAYELQVVSVAPSALPDGTAGTAYSQQLTAASLTLPAGTTFTFAALGALPAGLSLSPAGLLSGTPTAAGSGTFNVVATASTGDASAPMTYTFTATNPNQSPVAGNDTASTPAGTAVLVSVLTNDSDPNGDPLTVSAIGTPGNGTAAISGSQVQYAPNAGFAGTDTFTYTISDGRGGNATATVTVTVTPVVPGNKAPVAANDTASTPAGVAVGVAVLANDSDPDGDALSVATVTAPANGKAAINANKTVTYTPNAGFTGNDSFSYTISDGRGGTATATVSITVTPAAANRPPVAAADKAATPVSTAVTIDVLANDTDPDGDPLTIQSVGAPIAGTAVISGGKVLYTPPAGGQGTDQFSYTVSDGRGGTATATVTVTVGTPVANPLLVGSQQFAAGQDKGGTGVSFLNTDGSLLASLNPFPGFTGGVRVATADFTGDGVADIVAGTGPGRATRVVVFDGVTKQQLFAVDPFEAAFTGGVYVTAGDITGDRIADLVITPDEGGGPRVDVYAGAGFGRIASYFAFQDDPNFRGGARASVGDVNGDGVSDVVVSAGFGGGPRIATFDGTSVAAGSPNPTRLFGDFFAFEPTLRNGAFVAVGDLNADAMADLVTGGGPGGGPRVTAFSAADLIASNTKTVLANFFGGDVNNRGGIRVAVKNLDNDFFGDIVVGSGAGGGSRVTAYLGTGIQPAGTPAAAFDFDAFAGFVGGVFVG